VLGNLSEVMGKQLETGGWLPLDEDQRMHKYHSTPHVLVFFGYLGLNGAIIPQIAKAVDYCMDSLNRDKNGLFVRIGYPEAAECESAMFLRALLRLGFMGQKDVRDVCMAYLGFLYGREGLHCMHHKHLKGNPCIWVLIKDLMLLNEFPQEWRSNDYRQIVKNIQRSLLTRNLSGEDWFGRNWLKFGYFRNQYSSLFEGVEALTMSRIKNHPELKKALQVIGLRCIDNATWKAEFVQNQWPMLLETRQPSPWLSLRGLRIIQALSK
jgi:hypothetical protein